MNALKILLGLVLALMATSCQSHKPPQKEMVDAELSWAKRIVAEMLREPNANEKTTSDFPFWSKELQKEEIMEMDWIMFTYRGGEHSLKSAELSPSSSEVILTYRLEPPPKKDLLISTEMLFFRKLMNEDSNSSDPYKAEKPAELIIWMGKENAGRWVVQHVRLTVQEKGGG